MMQPADDIGIYRIRGIFGGDFNLAIFRRSAKIE